MLSTEMQEQASAASGWKRIDWIAALFLFLATAAVVVWQNSRLGVLWDLSYILENAQRISLGDVPYRDFPFPYAPLTFLVQAAIIKLTGRVFWHHIAYCATIGGLATVLTWRLLLHLLRDMFNARLLAFLLSLPLIVLGIYCVYPHPFYDPDCTLVMLVCLLLLQRLRRSFPSWLAFLTGVTLVVPLFVKQNTGLAFLASVGFALVVLLVIEAWHRRSIRTYLWVMGGVFAGLASALLAIQRFAGLRNYYHWTIQFAAARRAPALADMLLIYRDHVLRWWFAAFVVAVVLLRLNRSGHRWLSILSVCLMSLPFGWAAIFLLINKDASEQAERLIGVWPFVLVVAFVLAVALARRRTGFTLFVPLILIGTVQGAFMSQQLWGSTYALWPLLALLVATIITSIDELVNEQSRSVSRSWVVIPFATVIALTLLVSGGRYLWTHERLEYANLSEGTMQRSQLSALKGLSMRGAWLSSFEEMIAYTENEIPHEDGVLMIPGEDLFYYATGRRPRFPVLMFDHTVNPYSADEILELARSRDITWLIVKQELQLEEDQVDQDKEQILRRLERDFKQVASLKNYDIYRRRTAADSEEEQDDEKGEAGDSDK
jgi:hypothetical protein